MSGHWADAYVGLPATGKWPCWQLVRKVWKEKLGFIMPTFDDQETEEAAISIGDKQFVRVLTGTQQPFDAVMMNVPKRFPDGIFRKAEAHIGVVVKRDLVLHVHIGQNSVIEPMSALNISRIIRGPWKIQK